VDVSETKKEGNQPSQPVIAYVGLGSNMGDKRANLSRALDLLAIAPGIELLRTAPCYATAPVGYTQQDWFLNTVTELETQLPPLELLRLLLGLEEEMGRVRLVTWGPRIIDLDLLLYGQTTLESPELTLPHPRMHQRAFVLVPLADLAPKLEILGLGRALDLAVQLRAEQKVVCKSQITIHKSQIVSCDW